MDQRLPADLTTRCAFSTFSLSDIITRCTLARQPHSTRLSSSTEPFQPEISRLPRRSSAPAYLAEAPRHLSGVCASALAHSLSSLHHLAALAQVLAPIVFEAILAVASNTFDAYVDSASEDPQQSSNPVLELLYAESPQDSEPSWKSNELRDHFLNRVKTRIFESKFAQDIGTIQAAILVSVIEFGSSNTSSAFHFAGIACRLALDMNLHRTQLSTSTSFTKETSYQSPQSSAQRFRANSKADASRSHAQTQERLRVFWACFILDKILSTALDKPTQLRTAEIEADYPSVQESDEYELWINDVTRKFVDKDRTAHLEGVQCHALSSFRAWAGVMAILERILEEVYSPQAKRDRRRTNGASDYEALLRLNERLAQWKAELPSHLAWSGTWTSPNTSCLTVPQTRSADRQEADAHRGLPPHILTMRAWYCICLILLHRPRVPKLLEGPTQQDVATAEDIDNSAENAGGSNADKDGNLYGRRTSANHKKAEPAGLEICNAAAKEVCDILHVYGSSFRIRKISSSWVYVIFQTATIHAALAASKSVVAFKARQSSVWSRRNSKFTSSELISSLHDGQAEAVVILPTTQNRIRLAAMLCRMKRLLSQK